MDSSKLAITGPCPIDLDAIGFDRSSKRSHCSHCEKSVTILSNMTRKEAKGFLAENAGKRMCVSYAKNKAGEVQFKPEPPPPQIIPLSRLRPRPRPAVAAVAGLGLAAALAACTPTGKSDSKPTPDPIEHVAGGIGQAPDPVEKKPCEKTDDGGDELMVEGEIEAIPEPLAGDMMVPEPEVLEQVDGEMPIEKMDEPAEIHARGQITPPLPKG